MDYSEFNAEVREARANVPGGCVELYMEMKQRERHHEELMKVLEKIAHPLTSVEYEI